MVSEDVDKWKSWAFPDEEEVLNRGATRAIIGTLGDLVKQHAEDFFEVEKCLLSAEEGLLANRGITGICTCLTEAAMAVTEWRTKVERFGDQPLKELATALGHEVKTGLTAVEGCWQVAVENKNDETERLVRTALLKRTQAMKKLVSLTENDEDANDSCSLGEVARLTPGLVEGALERVTDAWRRAGVRVDHRGIAIPQTEVNDWAGSSYESLLLHPGAGELVAVLNEAVGNAATHDWLALVSCHHGIGRRLTLKNRAMTTENFGLEQIKKRVTEGRGCILRGNQYHRDEDEKHDLMDTQGLGCGLSFSERKAESFGGQVDYRVYQAKDNEVIWETTIRY